MNINDIKLSTVKVVIYQSNGNEIRKTGTAVLINENTALTARHVVYSVKKEGHKVKLEFPHLIGIGSVKVKDILCSDIEHLDIAILKFDELKQEGLYFPKLFAVEPKYQQKYQSHGYPKERINGCLFNGEITDIRKVYTQNDLELSCQDKKEINFKGASGSPLYIDEGVYGLIIVQDTGHELGAISFKECLEFLKQNKISYEQFNPLSNSEEAILRDVKLLEKIGFDDEEDLPYIDTVATWNNLSELNEYKYTYAQSPSLLEDMAEEFFSQDHRDKCKKILYVVSDFGKGKSVFLKHLATKHANQYMDTRTGYFPIYFNLRDFNEYDSFSEVNASKFGCILEFLKTKYNINIESFDTEELLQKKTILLLVDSLDECGSLKPEDIIRVMDSVKKSAKIFPMVKLIVTTRPIPNVIAELIRKNEPFENNWEYASVCGFIPRQFEKYMNLLKDKLKTNSKYSYNKELTDTIKNGQDIYSKFSEILSKDELKRPIIAYMLFKLLEQDFEIQKDSKLEVFLSFINMLTKDAKHINDKYKFNPEQAYIQQLSYRNLLYVTAVMWMKDRHIGGGGFLKLQDLIKILGNESSLIQFMSHSYFKNKKDIYYFNHQSFAEIILAEYYVRILIWMCIENKSVDEIMPLLNIGNPTAQTMIFVKGLIKLLIDSSDDSGKYNVAELRKMRKSIFPLVASLGVEEFNRKPLPNGNTDTNSEFYIYSLDIKTSLSVKQFEGVTEIPYEIIDEWPISEEILKNIMQCCVDIINSNDNYLFFELRSVNTLFGEVYKTSRRTQEFNMDIGRWLAVLMIVTGGNCNKKLGNYSKKIHPIKFIEMMKLHQLESGYACPEWIDELPELKFDMNTNYELKGLSFQEKIKLNNWHLYGSHMTGITVGEAKIKNLKLYKTSFTGAKFWGINAKKINLNGVSGKGTEFRGSYVENLSVSNCSLKGMEIHESFIFNCSFNDVDLRGSELINIYLINIKDFTKVRLEGSNISIKTDQKSYKKWKYIFKNYKGEDIEVISELEIYRMQQIYMSNTFK